VTRGRKLSPERKALLDAAVADGWPIRQIIKTYGIGTATVKNHYPDYAGMSQVEAGKLGMSIRWADQKMKKHGAIRITRATEQLCP
jgi:FixJ family two-component response regulator